MYHLISIFHRMLAVVLLGLVFLSGPAHADALEDLFVDTLSKAEKGNSVAMYDVGTMYMKGVGTPKDINEAMVWYQEASNVGYSKASLRLGKIFDEARVVPRDPARAFKWYKTAAEQGSDKARAKVAAMYSAGDGVEKNLQLAEEWSNPPKEKKEKQKVAKTTEKKKKPKQRPKKSKKTSKKKPSSTIDRIASGNWKKRKRPALYMPSKATSCNSDHNHLNCFSKKISGQQYDRTYTYRVRSTLKNFTPDGHFDVDVSFQLVDISEKSIEGYGQEAGESPRASGATISSELKKRGGNLSCELDGKGRSITCISDSGQKSQFAQ